MHTNIIGLLFRDWTVGHVLHSRALDKGYLCNTKHYGTCRTEPCAIYRREQRRGRRETLLHVYHMRRRYLELRHSADLSTRGLGISIVVFESSRVDTTDRTARDTIVKMLRGLGGSNEIQYGNVCRPSLVSLTRSCPSKLLEQFGCLAAPRLTHFHLSLWHSTPDAHLLADFGHPLRNNATNGLLT